MSDASAILGTWRLVSFTMEDQQTGARTQPMGPHPLGAIILHPDGRMMALLTPEPGKRPESLDEQVAAYRAMIAYSGRYRLEPPNRFVTTVDMALAQTWIGNDLARSYRLDGDRLTIVTDPGKAPGGGEGVFVGTLEWVRETVR
jgi:hypothetical protein